MSTRPERPWDRGLADLDAASSTSWLPWTGLAAGLTPVLAVACFVLAAVAGVLAAAAALAIAVGLVGAHLLLRRP